MAEIYSTEHGGRVPSQPRRVDETSAKVIGGGSSVAALCGLGAIVLGIIGLGGVMPEVLCSVAVLVAGAGLVFEGGAIAARFRRIRDVIAAAEGKEGQIVTEVGMTAQMVGGLGAIVLGILALVRIAPMTLLPVAAIVLGATLLFGSGGTYEAIELPASGQQSARMDRLAQMAASNAAGADVLIGIAAITIGILALIGVGGHVILLTLVALLSVGVGELVSDATLAARMASIFRHQH